MSHSPTLLHRAGSSISVHFGRQKRLFYKFGLVPRVIHSNNQDVGIGRKAKVFGKVEMPSGMGGVSGVVRYTVVDSPGVPPLTPVSLLKQVGAVIDLNNNTMELKKIETTTSFEGFANWSRGSQVD